MAAPPPPPYASHPTPPLPPQIRPAYPRPPLPAAGPREYAGFWIRLLAYVLDSLILGVAVGIVMVPGMVILAKLRQQPGPFIAATVAIYGLVSLLGLFYILYFWAVKGGTPGKKILGLRIVREDGMEPMGWGTAFMRFLGYIVDGFTLYIGFIMIAFTDRKRGLHDMIAGTTVVKTR